MGKTIFQIEQKLWRWWCDDKRNERWCKNESYDVMVSQKKSPHMNQMNWNVNQYKRRRRRRKKLSYLILSFFLYQKNKDKLMGLLSIFPIQYHHDLSYNFLWCEEFCPIFKAALLNFNHYINGDLMVLYYQNVLND